MVIVSSSGGVAGAVAFTTGLDPDKGIEELVARVGRGSKTEASALGVAPVTPLDLASGLLAATARVGDEAGIPAGRLQERVEVGDVARLVTDRVALGVGWAGTIDLPGVVVGDVGGETTESSGAASIFVDLGVHGSSRAQVGWPSEPTGVTGIEVHGHIGKIEGLDGIVGALEIGSLGAGALGDAQVGDQVGEGIRL